MRIDTETLCSQDPGQEIKIDFFRSETSGDHKHLGIIYTSLNELKEGKTNYSFKNSQVRIQNFQLQRKTNFLEYVFGGCKINLSIAIDFTLSNGKPNTPGSLHCQDF